MRYTVLSQDDQDETIVAFLLAQERDHHCHTVNKERYERMLLTLPAGKFRDRIEGLLAETNDRLEQVEAIIAATQAQVPPAKRASSAVARLKSKEAKG